ncbi:MAG TPA: PAS domain S-box protein, partial [Candidatus Ozemobacteraceae bacterium]|nr:PAS domain S-box protein [Candidatus Ozemobacteraceae bacterium]
GSIIWVCIGARLIRDTHGSPLYIQGFVTDITDQRLAGERINAAKKRLENIIEFLPDATYIIDAEHRIISWNRAIEEMTGISKKEMLGRDYTMAGIPFKGKPQKCLIDLLGSEDPEITAEYSHVKRKGASIFAEFYSPFIYGGKGAFMWAIASPLLDDAGNVNGIIESIRDITEQKRAEEEMRTATERFRSMMRAATEYSIIATSPDGVIRIFNEGAEQMLGYSASEVIDRLTPMRFHDASEISIRAKELNIPPTVDVLTSVAAKGETETREWTYIRKDDSRLNVLLTVTAMWSKDKALEGFIGIAKDISGQKRLEQQLIQAQKIESIGRLAGGIAHDFNNLLTPILGYAELLLQSMSLQDSKYEPLQMIRMAADGAKTLTRQLLAFSRSQVLDLKIVDPGEVIVSFEKILRRTIRENILIKVDVSSPHGVISADIGQIEQIMMNLAVNAQDAMPHGGHLDIGVSEFRADEIFAGRYPGMKPGWYVVLSVSDTGIGMTRQVKDRLFEPFFTTKEVGRGTGLGLSTVFGIVQQHGGFMDVYSEEGKGATFIIYLPRIAESLSSVPKGMSGDPKKVYPAASRESPETILIVEDEKLVRELASAMLERLGYHVLTAESMEKSFELAQQHKDAINLLLTDVIMPVMNGKQVFNHLLGMIPGLKVLYMSGYSRNIFIHDGTLEDGVTLLQKPLTLGELAEKVRFVLDSDVKSHGNH